MVDATLDTDSRAAVRKTKARQVEQLAQQVLEWWDRAQLLTEARLAETFLAVG